STRGSSFALLRLHIGASRRDVPVSAVGRDILSAPPRGARPDAQAGLRPSPCADTSALSGPIY
ncbi:MAG: hypothetical protein ACE5LB_15625, partial [Acidiferrobacterales bacterium]